MNPSGPIVVDGVIFQMQSRRPHGISRLWHSLLHELALLPRGKDLLLLDRDGSAPNIPGIQKRRIPPFSLRDLEGQAELLDEICRQEAGALFLSTYYSFTRRTPSALMVYDLILELFYPRSAGPADFPGMLKQLELAAKRIAIRQACAFMAISGSTAGDLARHYPETRLKPVAVIPCAVSDDFRVNSEDAVASFCRDHGIGRPYFLLVGRRGQYKNARFFLKALAAMPGREKFNVLMAGGEAELDPESRSLLGGMPWQIRFFSDRELSLAYGGATALVYPSLYEGFGLPVLEAMASGCPVITCRVSSLPEVAGDAALYVEPPDEHQMCRALEVVQQPETRELLISHGLRRASLFSWRRSAALFSDALDSALAGRKVDIDNRSAFVAAAEKAHVHNDRESSIGREGRPVADDTAARKDCPEPAIRVSAIVSTFSAEKFIQGCLQDLVGQTLYEKGLLEIIVVDSASAQMEGRIVKEFQQRHPNITYLRTDRCETVYQAWNRGLRVARGKYITNANTDDRHCKDALERMCRELDQRPEVALVYADVLKTATGNEVFDSCTPIGRYRWYDWDRNLLLSRGCFMGPQPMWRRSVHTLFGGFDESLVSSGDFEFWLRISQAFDFHHIREPLGLYLVRPDSVEHRHRELKQSEDYRIISRYHEAASNGRIVRCLPLEELRQAPRVHPRISPDRLREIIGQIETLAGLNPCLSRARLGDHPGDVSRFVEIKRQVLQTGAAEDAFDELICLASAMILNRMRWFLRYRENPESSKRFIHPGAAEPAEEDHPDPIAVLPAADPTAVEIGNEIVRLRPGSLSQPRLTPEVSDKTSRLRQEMFQFWMKAPMADLARLYGGDAGNLHRTLVFEWLPQLPVSPDEREAAAVIVDKYARGEHDDEPARFLLAAMLYLPPCSLPPQLDFSRVPEWLQQDFTRFMLIDPGFFQNPGEVEVYFDQLDQLTGLIHVAVQKQPQSIGWQKLAVLYSEKVNFLPLYFARRNLKELSTRRAAISDFAQHLLKRDLAAPLPPSRPGRRKLRLGVYCRSLRPSTETYATLPVFEYLDRDEFEVHCYVHAVDGGAVEARVRRLTDKFVVLPEATRPCVEALRADDLDILFFGNNLTAVQNSCSILANYRMARIQCIHFCNPVTSGKRHIDHFLMGRLIADRGNPAHAYTESILTIDGSGICFDMIESEQAPTGDISRQDLGIASGRTVFLSGANYHKIIPELRRTWAEIMDQLPGSILCLYPFGPAWANTYPKPLLIENLSRVFAERGISPDRLVVLDSLKDRGAVAALNRMADVYLDAVPYSGATSLLDPLLAGLPPVVVGGSELRFGQGAAMLRELGIPDLVASDDSAYIGLAVRLGRDPCLRNALRQRIRERMEAGPDFLNPRLYGQRVSSAFRRLFKTADHVSGHPSDCYKPHPVNLSASRNGFCLY